MQQLYDEAKRAQTQGHLETAISKYENILRIAPKLGAGYNNLGALYFRERKFTKAATILEQGLEIDPSMTSAAALLGIALFQTGEYSRARPLLERGLKANPGDADLQLYLAKDLIKIPDPGAAAAALNKIAVRQPRDQEVLYLLAKVYMQMSEQTLARMNAIDPNSVFSHQLSAEVMESMNNYDGAVVELKKAVAVSPRLPGVHYKLGDAYWNLSAWDQASDQFETELEIDPANCMAQWKVGNILLQKGAESEAALAAINKAIVTCPALGQARMDRARVLTKLNRNQEAVNDLESAEKAMPSDPNVHFLLAKVYRALGRTQEANLQMQQFSKLDEAARAATAERAEEVIRNKQTAH